MSTQAHVDGGSQSTVDQACARMRERLLAGDDCHAEDFLTASPTLAADSASALQLVVAEFTIRQELGQQPTPTQWYERFPQWREQLHQALSGAAPSVTGSTVAASRPGNALLTASYTPGVLGRLGRYELHEEVGRGGMGIVHRAYDTALKRVVAIKMLRAGANAHREEIERFRLEAWAAARLSHEYIVPIYDVGEHDGRAYFAMQFVGGGSLSTESQRLWDDPQMALLLMEKIAAAVQYAHEKGVIHRDLKLANVLLDNRGEPLITDFGLAKCRDLDLDLTRTGMTLGTPAYMSPEQTFATTQPCPATDVWALGVMLYELLTRQRPFAGRTEEEIKRRIREFAPRSPRDVRPELNAELERIVLKCLEKSPRRRYRSAGEMAAALQSCRANGPLLVANAGKRRPLRQLIRRHWMVTTAVAVCAVVGLAVIVSAFLPSNDSPTNAHGQTMAAEPITLIGADGKDMQFRWVTGEKASEIEPLREGNPFTVTTTENALIELRGAAPWPRFRLEAEVRQINGTFDGPGVYFGHRPYFSATKGLHHSFFRFSIKASQANFRHSVIPDSRHQSLAGSDLFGTLVRETPEWRKLIIEVDAEEIRLRDGDQFLGTVHKTSLLGAGSAFASDMGDVSWDYDSCAGIGLHIFEGSASFRNVIVAPLVP